MSALRTCISFDPTSRVLQAGTCFDNSLKGTYQVRMKAELTTGNDADYCTLTVTLGDQCAAETATSVVLATPLNI
jgi:hypothetical protein